MFKEVNKKVVDAQKAVNLFKLIKELLQHTVKHKRAVNLIHFQYSYEKKNYKDKSIVV
ncbi:fibrinogen-binding protein [Staphylococcus aureus]